MLGQEKDLILVLYDKRNLIKFPRLWKSSDREDEIGI